MFRVQTTRERLQKLRQENQLSQPAAIKRFNDNESGCSLSVDTLKKYESKKNTAIAGMSAETLARFAEMYGVSADYLLGLSDVQSASADVKATMQLTGLNEKAIQTIANEEKTEEEQEYCLSLSDFLNVLLSDPDIAERIAAYFAEMNYFINVMAVTDEKLNDDEFYDGLRTETLHLIAARHCAYDLSNEIYLLLKKYVEDKYFQKIESKSGD